MSYRLLIADDQETELKGIIDLFDWSEFDIEIVGTAQNGRDALSLIEERRPDIVIADIVMPKMDGITLLSEVNRTHPEIRFICISCFDDFKFTKAAIEHRAAGYCLKPIVAGELEHALRSAIGGLEGRGETAAESAPHPKGEGREKSGMLDVFWRELLFDCFDAAQLASQAAYLTIPYNACGYTVVEVRLDNVRAGVYPPVRLISKLMAVARGLEIYALAQDMKHVSLIFAHDSNERRSSVSLTLDSLMKRLALPEGAIRFGVGPMVHSLEALHESYQGAHNAGDGRSAVSGIEEALPSEVLSMMRYIDFHFTEPIQTSDVARSAHLSTNYANACFKRVYGKTIHDVLEEKRIGRAVQILRDRPDLHVYQIAEMAGFQDSAYFNRDFRRLYGCTPTVFQYENH